MSRPTPGDRFVSSHWRQRGLIVEVLRVGHNDVEVCIVEPGESTRERGATEIMPRYMLDDAAGPWPQGSNPWKIVQQSVAPDNQSTANERDE